PNPHIPFDTLPLEVQRTLAPWPEEMRPALGGVSSFGFGGTNVHMILEEGPAAAGSSASLEAPDAVAAERAYLIPLSAKSPEALSALVGAFRVALEPPAAAVADASLADLAYSASRRRTHHEHRLALVARSGPEAADHLGAFLAGDARPGLSNGRAAHGRRKKLAFVFPGQGAQWFGMARGLMKREPVFAAAIEECERAIRDEVGWSVRDELLADPDRSRLAAVDVIQPVLFAVQAGLAALWRSWGVEPDAVVGHSMGEVAAAYVAGALSLEAAARVICRRSRLLRRTSGRGAMAAVELSIEEARRALAGYEDRVSIAVNSSPSSTVLSGDPAALEEIIVRLEAQSVFCRRVKVDVASHSPQMDPLRAELLEVLAGVHAQPGKVPLYSTVTGEASREPDLDATYWVRNLREPVLFSDAVQRLVQDGHSVFLELSPHPILLPAVQQGLRHIGKDGVVLPSLRREEDEQAVMLGSLGALFTLGRPVRWEVLYPAGRSVRLPAYPWQRERFWLEDAKKIPVRGGTGHPLLGPHLRSAAQGTHFWDIELGTDTHPFLSDHRVQDAVVLPAAAYLEMALAAAREAFGPGPLAIEDVELKKALFIPDEGGRRLQLVLSPSRPGVFSLQFFGVPSLPDADASPPVLHATATLRLAATEPAPPAEEPRAILARCPEASTAAEHYDAARTRGLEYGPAFQAVRRIQRRDGEAIARLRLSPDLHAAAGPYQVHPVLLDACFQVLAAALSPEAGRDGPYLPVGIASLRTEAAVPPGDEYWGHAVLHPGPPPIDGSIHGDVFLRDERGHAVLSARGLRLKRLEGESVSARASHDDWLYEVSWLPASRPERSAGRAPRGAAQRWIVFADRQGVGEALGALLEARGDACVIVSRGETYEALGPRRYQLNAAEGDHFRRLLQDAFGNGALSLRGAVHLWSLDVPALEGTATGALDAARDLGGLSVLHLVQSLVLAPGRQKPRLWLVTTGAQAVDESESVSVGQSLAWGLGRTVSHEHPELGCTNVDLGAAAGADAATGLFAEIAADDGEDRVALRGGARHVARLVRSSAERMLAASLRPGPASASGPFRLEISAPGVLENLVLRAARREEPGPGQVEIQVEAAALNFSDVLLALGLIPALPDGSVPLGLECAGVVTAIGEGVAGLRPGDEVIAMPSPALASHVVTASGFVAPKPPGLGFEEAATLPVAFLTAYYALHHLGRLAAGERVLIHSASGGVGLAAVHIARGLKAEIYATAGTAEKRDFLRSLGIERVADSRSLAFADEVRAWTGGEGVDVVLNSLAGDAIARGMALLRPGGRFLELGKRDILQDSPLGLRLLRNNRAFFAIDLYALARDRPAQLASLLSETMRFIREHAIAPLPFRTFPASQAETAFRHLAHGKHVGKVVLSMRDPEVRPVPEARGSAIRSDVSYLVTGGLGGLGLAVARWLVDEGARSLVLVGRHGPSPEARTALETMETAGARVTVALADVSDAGRLAAVLADIDERLPPLRGIIHAAGVLNDGILARMDKTRFESVMGAKVDGAWHLHEQTAGRPLDFFILFSSAAGVLGSPGQGNYSAASAFLDALAFHRRAAGLPALSIDWGPWSEVGLAARPDRGGRLAAQGMESLTPRQGVSVFAQLLKGGPAQVAVMPVDWHDWREVHRAAAGSPLLANFADEEPAVTDAGPRSTVTAAMLLATGLEERQQVLNAHLRQEVARVLGLSASKLDVNQPLSTLGIDSLMAVELKNRIETDLKVSVPLIKVIQGPSVAELTALLLGLLAGVDASLAEAPAPIPPTGRAKGESLLLSILSLSDDERNG
ncbi:MAG TPA: type I polyketide synthase, partial [Vicinamibacteria bacterium]|nr:type I polyketide synthase [Vicinamibacteria bacterium]